MWRRRGLHIPSPSPRQPLKICIYVHVQANTRFGIIYFTLLLNWLGLIKTMHRFIKISSLHQYLRITTPPFTNAQPLFCFILFFKHSSRFFFLFFSWVAFASKVGTVLRIYVELTYRDFWRTRRRTNPIYEIVALGDRDTGGLEPRFPFPASQDFNYYTNADPAPY